MNAPSTATGWTLPPRRGALVTVEGVWGAGKTTAAAHLAERLRGCGLTTEVIHIGERSGSIGRLSAFLESAPLRARTGTGGFAAAHHAPIDALLRLAREAHHHQQDYGPALTRSNVVIVDTGVYSKIAYALAILAETDPDPDPDSETILARLSAVTAPWFVHPDVAVYLDVPWPLARERAIARGHGGGNPAAAERLLFLPRYVAAYRSVLAAHAEHVERVRVGLRPALEVADEIAAAVTARLNLPPLPELAAAA
jgi:dTMP kinase